jgi:3-deoxy-D-manno-octulosonic-acid transferase
MPAVITLGSVRPGEEAWWFDALMALKERGLAAKMIVAPRHAEKFSYFADRIASLGLPFARWSEINSWSSVDHDILLLDTMGKLEDAYAVADLAFVGATLVDIGGHNPMEPAMYAAPVVVGPYTSVVRDVVDDMRSLGGIVEVRDAASILRALERAAQRDPLMRQIGEKGQRVWEQHRGAAERITAVLRHE